MLACPLRKQQNASNDDDRENCGGGEAAEREPAVGNRLIQQITKRGSQRSRQDERDPEQQNARDVREEIRGRDERQASAKDQRAVFVAETKAASVRPRHPVAKRGAEGLREHDRHPVEYFNPGRGDRVDVNRTFGPAPRSE